MRADQTCSVPAPAAEQQPAYTYAKKKDTRWWEVRDRAGELVLPNRVPPRRAGSGAKVELVMKSFDVTA